MLLDDDPTAGEPGCFDKRVTIPDTPLPSRLAVPEAKRVLLGKLREDIIDRVALNQLMPILLRVLQSAARHGRQARVGDGRKDEEGKVSGSVRTLGINGGIMT
jgi:hypothetical protein